LCRGWTSSGGNESQDCKKKKNTTFIPETTSGDVKHERKLGGGGLHFFMFEMVRWREHRVCRGR